MASLYLSQNRPMSLNKTAYGEANEWMKMPGKIIPDNVPVTLSDGNWRRIPMMPGNRRNVYDSTPEERFQKAYQEMTQRIAYRHPNPGMPRSRQGRIGGTWRHVKEVLGHSGSQICFVDGLVRMYDSSNMNESLSAAATTRPHLSSNAPRERAILPAYAPQIPPKTPRCRYNKYDITDHTGRVQAHQAYEYEHCLPSVRASSGTPNVSGKYQGFYRLK